LILLLAFLGLASAQAQDAEPDAGDDTQAEQAPDPAEDVTDEEIEELLGLDEDYTEAEDDDFDPTVDVRFEQSVPFPTDI
jgi:hypothetical protein